MSLPGHLVLTGDNGHIHTTQNTSDLTTPLLPSPVSSNDCKGFTTTIYGIFYWHSLKVIVYHDNINAVFYENLSHASKENEEMWWTMNWGWTMQKVWGYNRVENSSKYVSEDSYLMAEHIYFRCTNITTTVIITCTAGVGWFVWNNMRIVWNIL